MPGDRAAPDGNVAGWFRHRYAAAAPATWSRKLATPRSAATWWRAQGRLAADPTVLVERHRETPDRARALTVARATEILSLDGASDQLNRISGLMIPSSLVDISSKARGTSSNPNS